MVWLLYSTIGPENTEFSLFPQGISFPRIGYFNYFGFDFTKLGQKAPDALRNLWWQREDFFYQDLDGAFLIKSEPRFENEIVAPFL